MGDVPNSLPTENVPVVLVANPDSLRRKSMVGAISDQCIYFTGYIFVNDRMIMSPEGANGAERLPALTVCDVAQSCGEFLAVFVEKSTSDLIIITDFHGFYPLFYFIGKSGEVVLSNMIFAAVQEMRARVPKVCPNGPVLIAEYSTFNALLNHHSFGSSTAVCDLFKLRPDKLIRISRNGVSLFDRARFEDPKGRAYPELVSDGLKRGADMLNAIVHAGFGEHMIYLSGGRDSRSVLALALQAGLESQFPVYSKPPGNSGSAFDRKLAIDRAIAGQIFEQFNLDLWRGECRKEFALPAWPVRYWLSHSAGVSHDFEFFLDGSTKPSARLIGSNGEGYRSKVAEYLSHIPDLKLEMIEGSFESDSHNFFERICPRQTGQDLSNWSAARDEFLRSLEISGVRRDFWHRLNGFSELFRMPAHFGRLTMFRSVNVWHLNALAIPEFTYAASLLDCNERDAGLLCRSLLGQVDERLVDLPFESHGLSIRELRDADLVGRSAQTWETVDREHREWLQANSGNVDSSIALTKSEEDFTAADALLSNVSEELAESIGQPRVAHLRKLVSQRALLSKRLRGKLEVFSEIVFPKERWYYEPVFLVDLMDVELVRE